MKRLAIIPARGGSKRFPNKNLTPLGGKPLIFHSIDASIGLFEHLIFTSDSEEMLALVGAAYGSSADTAGTRFEVRARPPELASDTSKVIDTVSALYDAHSGYDQIWLMLPTCPLRSREDIQAAKKLLSDDLDAVISITDYEFPPSLGLLSDADGQITAYDDSDPWRSGNSRSQDHPTVYRPNGALYGSWWSAFGKHRNFYKGKVRGYAMPRERSVDIDTPLDLKVAEVLLGES